MKDKHQKLACDVVTIAGFVVFAYGLWLAWKPLGFIVGGLAIAAGAFFMGYQLSRPGSGN
jgi:hypothetical protein